MKIVAIAPTENRIARRYFQTHDIPFICLGDGGRKIYAQYGVESKAISLGQHPGVFVIDKNGITRFAHVGWQQWDIPSNDDVLRVCDEVCGPSTK